MNMRNAIDRLFETEALKEADRQARFDRLERAVLAKRERSLKESYNDEDIRDRVYEAIESGILSWDVVGDAALRYLSTDDIRDLNKVYDWGLEDNLSDEDIDDVEEGDE